MLDVGANIACDAERLVEFAIMGAAFHHAVHGSTRPTVGLLNVGSEDEKGHEEVREAHRMLRELPASSSTTAASSRATTSPRARSTWWSPTASPAMWR